MTALVWRRSVPAGTVRRSSTAGSGRGCVSERQSEAQSAWTVGSSWRTELYSRRGGRLSASFYEKRRTTLVAPQRWVRPRAFGAGEEAEEVLVLAPVSLSVSRHSSSSSSLRNNVLTARVNRARVCAAVRWFVFVYVLLFLLFSCWINRQVLLRLESAPRLSRAFHAHQCAVFKAGELH